MKEEIYNAQLIHYENLLIKKLDEIATTYKKRRIIKILSPIGGLCITILGWSNDNIGPKALEYLMKFFGLNLDSNGISYMIYITINICLLITSVYSVFKAKQIKKGITVEFLKEPLNQYKLLTKYILNKYKDKLPYKADKKEFFKYYSIDKKITKIQFCKSDFRNYLATYLDRFNTHYDISRYLAEVIILRRLIEKQMVYIDSEYYEEIISSKNNITYSLTEE